MIENLQQTFSVKALQSHPFFQAGGTKLISSWAASTAAVLDHVYLSPQPCGLSHCPRTVPQLRGDDFPILG